MEIRDLVLEQLSAACGLAADELSGMLEVPPSADMGDYAFPCFRLAKTMRKSPVMIAEELAQKIQTGGMIDRVEAVKGYLNFYLNRTELARSCLEPVLTQGEAYGSSDVGRGKTICIDYSSINIAKRFHIGHLSTTVIGHALYRIYNFRGYKSVGINHLGDWGTQFGKMIAAYRLWGDKETVEKNGVDAMVELYVKFHEEAEKDPSLEDEGRRWFKAIEDNDPEATEIFNWFKEVTLRDAMRIYDMLGIEFDSYAGESFYNDKMDRVIDELNEKGLLIESDGARVVDLEPYQMPPCLILKSDGTTIYATRDLAAALYRKDTYDFAKCLYVVAYQQNLHFRQCFKVLELMGYDWAKDCEHVAFGMVSYEGQTLATRKGHVVYLDDLLNRAIEKADAIIAEKTPDLANRADVARQVGIGSVVFSSLVNNRIKDIDFWWDRALSFDGETAPYVQYTHARCCSLLRRAEEAGIGEGDIDYSVLADDAGMAVLKALQAFPEAIAQAEQRNEPYLVTRSVLAVTSAFNHYYIDHRVIDEDENVTRARVALTRAVKTVLKTGLYLIGIEAPERM